MVMLWLIGTICVAFAALQHRTSRPWDTLGHFMWLGIIALWVFGGVFIMAP